VTIDLSASYAKAVRQALPDAVLVADRFHLVHLANDMLTQVRQRVTRESQGRHGHKSDPAWTSRRRLPTAHERLRPEAFARMWNSLIDTGDAGVQVLQAYVDRRSSAPCSPVRHKPRTPPHPARAWTASTGTPQEPTHPRHTASPPTSRPGGQRSRRGS
jgi:Transposase